MKKLIIGFLAGLFLTSVAVADNTINVTRKDSMISIRLESNPTTGYQWSLDVHDKRYIGLADHYYVAPESKLLGASGHEVWLFNIKPIAFKMVNQTKFDMIYARSWNKANVGKRVTYTINFKSRLR